MKARSLVWAAVLAAGVGQAAEAVKLTRLDDRVRVEIAGRLFTEYVFRGASRPYCYPVLAADGTPLTRGFPTEPKPGEETDHPWQRSLIFEHCNLNEVDFWNEKGGGATTPKDKGTTVLEALLETTSGPVGVLRARHRYVGPEGRVICTDERTLRFFARGETRFLDYEVTLHAPSATALRVGDNKDGTMAIRVAQWMVLPHDTKTGHVPGVGHIVTSNGQRDAAAWAARADWCDYFAEHDGRTYGIAMFDHPQNLRHPTWWMVRDYGLFAANPFGWHDFEPKTTAPQAGDFTIPAGKLLTLRYRFCFHFGDERAAGIAALYREYAGNRASGVN